MNLRRRKSSRFPSTKVMSVEGIDPVSQIFRIFISTTSAVLLSDQSEH